MLLETASGSRPPPPGPASLQSTQSRTSHAAAGRDLAAISEPGHLWPGEAGDARCSDDSSFSMGHALMLLALLKAPHVCRKRRCRGQGSIHSQGLLSRERMLSRGRPRRKVGAPHIPSGVSNPCPRWVADTPGELGIQLTTFIDNKVCHRACYWTLLIAVCVVCPALTFSFCIICTHTSLTQLIPQP